MKRLILWLCLILCLTLTCRVAGAEDMNYTLLASNPAGEIKDICGHDGEWYLLTRMGVYRWAGPGSEPGRMVDLSLSQRYSPSSPAPSNVVERQLWEKGLDRIFLLDGQLMGLHPYTGQLSLIQEGETVPFAQLPEEQYCTLEQDDLVPKEMVGFVAQNDTLYMAFKTFSITRGETTELYAWKPGDAAMTLLEAPDLATIFPGDNGLLLARCQSDRSIRLYDPQTQTYTRTLCTETEDIRSGYVWDAATETLYFTNWEGAVQVVSPNGQAQTKAYLPLNFASVDQARLLPGNAYLAVVDGKLFVRALTEGEAERVTLKILGLVNGSLLTGFAAEHPDINITSSYDESTDLLNIQQSIVSGDSDVDLYIVNSNHAYAAVKEKGYAASLDGSDVLTQRAKQMYPAIQSVLTQEGELVAYPASMIMDCWSVNITQWELLGLGDYPTTWTALVDFLQRWEEDYADLYPTLKPLNVGGGFKHFVALAVRQYLLEQEVEGDLVSFDAEELRQVLEAMLAHRELFQEREGLGEYTFLIEPYQIGYGLSGIDADVVMSILPPAMAEDSPRRVAATLELFVLNPLSRHQPEAMAFLEYYAEHVSADWQYALSPANNVPLRYDGYEAQQEALLTRIDYLTQTLETLEAADRRETEELIEAERRRYQRREAEDWAVSQESIDVYQAVAAHLTLPLRSIYTGDAARSRDKVIDQAVTLFADGQLSAEQFIRLLNDKARMVFQEGL